uniref:Serpin domain-containing protein n=1 Tax=Panagrolaimus superbus TaxID=310955 RepID=A0A914Y1I7_9BILA
MRNTKMISAEKQANFTLNFLQQTIQVKGLKSLILSPLSLSIDLAVIYNGASKDTAKQLANVLIGGKLHS